MLEQLIPYWYQKKHGFKVELEKAQLAKAKGSKDTKDPISLPGTVPQTANRDVSLDKGVKSS